MSIPLIRRPSPRETRTAEQLVEHYLLEKELAGKLLSARKDDRARMYSWAYEELFRRIPHHPQLRIKSSPQQQAQRVAQQMQFLERWLTPKTVFVEIGAGDCALSFAVAPKVAHVYAIDVSETITAAATRPQNFELRISDGTSIPIPEGHATLAYSNQLMEHLHPEDALHQLSNIYRALAPGGRYICITPNRMNGPHDISRYFDDVASGFHLKEYTVSEIVAMFRSVGFRTARQHLRTRRGQAVPNWLATSAERFLESTSPATRHRLLDTRPLRWLSEIRVVAVK